MGFAHYEISFDVYTNAERNLKVKAQNAFYLRSEESKVFQMYFDVIVAVFPASLKLYLVVLP